MPLAPEGLLEIPQTSSQANNFCGPQATARTVHRRADPARRSAAGLARAATAAKFRPVRRQHAARPSNCPPDRNSRNRHIRAARRSSPVAPDAQNAAPLRAFRDHLGGIRCREDSGAVAAVRCEPFSAAKFPVKQGKYREFSRFRAWSAPTNAEKCRICKGLSPNSLLDGTGNFICRTGNFFGRSGNFQG